MTEKNKLIDELEREQTEINIERSQPLLKKDITILEYALLDYEMWALIVAFKNKTPMSTGHYYNNILIDKYNKNINSAEQNTLSKISNFTSKDFRKLEILLRSKNISFPSYKKILSILKNMEKYGLLISRQEKGSKAIAYWYISPQFLIKYGEQFKRKYVKLPL